MKEIKGLRPVGQDEKPNPVAVAIGKTAEYLLLAGIFVGMCAMVAFVVMMSLGVMHRHEPAVPPFGFMFIWAAVWGSSVLGLWAGNLVKSALKEE